MTHPSELPYLSNEPELTRFFTPPSKGTWGVGSERSPDPYGSNPAVGARELALVGKLGVPVVRPKPASSASRAAAHNRPWGAKAGARAAAVMPSATLRGTAAPLALPTSSSAAAHGTFHQNDGRSLPAKSSHIQLQLHLTYRPSSPCRRCLVCPHERPLRVVSQSPTSACFC